MTCVGSVLLGMSGAISIENAMALSAGYVVDLAVWCSWSYLTVRESKPTGSTQRAERRIVVAGLLLAVLPFAAVGSARLKDGYEQPIQIAWTCPVPPPDVTLELVVLSGTDYGPIERSPGQFNPDLQQAALDAEKRGEQKYLSVERGDPLSTRTQPIISGPHTYVLWRYLISTLEAAPFDGVQMRNNLSAAATAVLTLGHSLHSVPHISDFTMDCAQAEILRKRQLT